MKHNVNIGTQRRLCAIALAAVLALALAACANGTTDSGGSGGITITDIPARYEGLHAYLVMRNEPLPDIMGGREIRDWRYTLVQIRGGKATIPLWTLEGERYTGSDTYIGDIPQGSTFVWPRNYIMFHATLQPSATPQEVGNAYCRVFFGQVTFASGSATISWNDAGRTEEVGTTPAETGNPATQADFAGRWHNEASSSDYSYTFTGNTFTFNDSGRNYSYSGTFTFTNTTITFKLSQGQTFNDLMGWTQGYVMDDTVIYLTDHGQLVPYGAFTKQ